MTAGRRVLSYFPDQRSINWRLLLFLLLFIDVKPLVKLLALIIIYFLQPDLKFGFTLKRSRLPLFYLLAIVIAFLNWMFSRGFLSNGQSLPFLIGCCFWIACILAMHQMKLFTERTGATVLTNTIALFFIINALASYGELLRIMIGTGTFNPYLYQGDYQKYFISTGDYIKGASLDTSVTNAALNGFGVLFFLSRRKTGMVLLCMSVLLLTVSNLTNILLLVVLLYVFIFNSDRDQKSMITVCSFLLILFLARITPQNDRYISEVYARLTGQPSKGSPKQSTPLLLRADSSLSTEDRKQKIAILYLDSMNRLEERESASKPGTAARVRPVLPQPNIHSAPYQHRDDTTGTRRRLLAFIGASGMGHSKPGTLPGKLLAARQTLDQLRTRPATLFMGEGMGRFSSKLAFRTAALGISGSYPESYRYIDPAFGANHLSVYLSYFSANPRLHSVINSPNSVYLQLAGEYGILGIIAFACFYIGYFIMELDIKGHGVALMLFLLGLLCTDYWFEQLSIIPFFELLMFLYAKEKTAHE